MDTRGWAARGAFVVTAFAVVATSPARWGVAADLPTTKVPPNRATLLTIESSERPNVTAKRASGDGWVQPFDAPQDKPWPGRAQYVIPAGEELSGVGMFGICANAGMCDGRCAPPPGAFVRVVGVEAVTEWTLTAESAPQMVALRPEQDGRFEIVIEATRTAEVRGRATGNDVALLDSAFGYEAPAQKYQSDDAGAPSKTMVVTWRMKWDVPKDTGSRTIPWTAIATIRGFCRGDGECKPPESESVKILSVTAAAAP
jgi:hypothetical protein